MANLRDIKRRINSVSSTQQITRTMEMVSTAKISQALQREQQSEAYLSALTDVMLTVSTDPSVRNSSPLLQDPKTYDRALLIVVNSDRGLAGGFNVQVQRSAEARIDHFQRHGAKAVELITCGRKATEHFQGHPDVVMSFVGQSDKPTMEEARQIANYVCDGFASGKLGRVDIVYFHARNRVDQVLREERILPLDPEMVAMAHGARRNESEAPKQLGGSFKFIPSAEEVLSELLPSYVLNVIYQALIDSAAAEHAARRKAMHAATESANEIIADLQRTYNRVRQASITTEITEIVSGASALEEES